MSEWHPPTEAELAAVADMVQQAVRDIRAACRRAEKSRPLGLAPRPLPDVTLKGDALRKSRALRGCNVPVEES